MKSIQVINGANHEHYSDLGGRTVGFVRKILRDIFNIGPNALAYVNGECVPDETILCQGDELEFFRKYGRKGLGKLISPEQLMKSWNLNAEQYQTMLQSGLPTIEIAGDVRHPELDLDVFTSNLARFNSKLIYAESGDRDQDGTIVSQSNNAELIELKGKLEQVEKGLELANSDREWFSTKEAAEQTGYSKFVVMQACNLKRIPSEYFKKTRSKQWRISKTGITYIKENGLSKGNT